MHFFALPSTFLKTYRCFCSCRCEWFFFVPPLMFKFNLCKLLWWPICVFHCDRVVADQWVNVMIARFLSVTFRLSWIFERISLHLFGAIGRDLFVGCILFHCRPAYEEKTEIALWKDLMDFFFWITKNESCKPWHTEFFFGGRGGFCYN